MNLSREEEQARQMGQHVKRDRAGESKASRETERTVVSPSGADREASWKGARVQLLVS